MGDLKSPRVIWLKGGLFLMLGMIAAGQLVLTTLDTREAILLCIAVWAFCRAYYFAFYVIQHYVDADYRFAGLLHFLRYCLKHRARRSVSTTDNQHGTARQEAE